MAGVGGDLSILRGYQLELNNQLWCQFFSIFFKMNKSGHLSVTAYSMLTLLSQYFTIYGNRINGAVSNNCCLDFFVIIFSTFCRPMVIYKESR